MCEIQGTHLWQQHRLINVMDYTRHFQIDTWNNTDTCCDSFLVKPTINDATNVKLTDTLDLSVDPKRSGVTSSSISSNFKVLYGSFRANVSITSIPGTSFGFFYYRNNYQEIDMEILSYENDRVRTAIQPIIRDSSGTANALSHRAINATLEGTFTELRFDWFPSHVDFYVNGEWTHNLTVNVPHTEGKIVFNHRSNGNPKWSRGPPPEIATVKIQSMDFYYNTTIPGCGPRPATHSDSGFNYIPIVIVGAALVLMVILILSVNYILKIRRPTNKTVKFPSSVEVPEPPVTHDPRVGDLPEIFDDTGVSIRAMHADTPYNSDADLISINSVIQTPQDPIDYTQISSRTA